MPSSFSTDLKLELMVTGENAGTWGTKTNTNLNLLQQAIAGYQDISIAGGPQTTALTMDNAAISNARNAVVKLTGTITGNQIVTVPNGIEKTYIVSNGTVGAFTVEFKTASGTGPTFSTTDKGIKILFADGTNIVDVNADLSASTFASISSGQIDILAQAELRLQDTTGGQYVGFKAPGTVSSSYTLTLPTATGAAGQTLVTNGSGVLSFATAGLSWQSVQTTGFTAVKGNAYPCNTTSAGFTVTLPATPSAGDQVQLVDYAGTFDTNALVIDPNGEDIEGGTNDLQLSGEREGVILTYLDSTQGWIATSGINEGTDALSPIPYSIDFLVIAGGGGGGSTTVGAGGGAGGYRTSTQTVNQGTVITITVGDGGAGGVNGPNPGVKGSDSSISGSGLSTITSTGGGFGGSTPGTPGADGGSGGSGGGGTRGTSPSGGAGGAGNTPSTSPSQGNNGGGSSPSAPNYGTGGGGGASAVGVSGTSTTGGNGGNGTASSITGSSVTRAGGGGGSLYLSGTAGTGGAGGGGNGSIGTGTAGTVNTGGGGGGSERASGTGNGGAGGKGVVILSLPTAFYSSTSTGSPTVTTSGSNTILQFNGSGSYTA
jgi:hypothetical protein